jgi:uncharacterized protein YyaL (SSP411 family)
MTASEPAERRHTNRLIRESSPYLLQHAHNPVDWWPWCAEAHAEARRRGVPVFLSIGYSTCYWCHVMERESFEHEPTAAVMNERFVCIKVDREERPDLDDLYMAATLLMNGHGGWPMSVFLEPERLRPFWAGTYFPREPRGGMPSFRQVLTGMSDAYATRRGEVLEQAGQLAEAVGEQVGLAPESAPVGSGTVTRAVQSLLAIFDRAEGGFGRAPKFPQPVFLDLLLEVRERAGDEATRTAIDTAVRTTLDAMLAGGIHDQVGGGFHRYSVDAHWTVPHFEKMLYDNGQLLSTYARAAAVYGDPQYRRVVARTAAHLLRDMALGEPAGAEGFASALDAEVDRREGLNYLWTPEGVRAALGGEDAAFAERAYGLDRPANFRDPHHPDDAPAWVLRLDGRPESVAELLGTEPAAFVDRLDQINAQLLAVRDARTQPHRDDKVLTAWNALAIAGLADAAAVLTDRALFDAASRAADFLLRTHRDANGTLLRVSRAGAAKTPGFLEDHSFLAAALLALRRAAGVLGVDAGERAAQAAALMESAEAAFGDGAGGFYDTRDGQADLFVRARTTHDGATPAGATVALGVLVDLAEAVSDPRWTDRARACLASMSGAVAGNPVGSVVAVRHLLRLLQRGAVPDEAEPAAAKRPAARERSPVQVYADTERVRVTKDTPAVLTLLVRIPPGHHIVAADPGESPAAKKLSPLRIGLVSGQGVAVYADYPPGEPHGLAETGAVLVHHGSEPSGSTGHDGLAVRVLLERAEGVGVGPGRPILGVSFQACTDAACLAPTAYELDVAIDLD